MQAFSSPELLDRMAARRSVRRFTTQRVPRELMEQLIAAAVTAPSASNKQPWRWLVVTDSNTIASLAAAARAAVAELAGHVQAKERAAFGRYAESFSNLEGAPVVVVPLYRSLTLLSHLVSAELPAQMRNNVATLERDSALVSTSLAIQNLLLMASELGLGATVMTGPLLAAEEIRHLLHVRPSWQPAALIPVGFPAETPQPPGRKPWTRVTRWIETPGEEQDHGS